MIISHKRLEEMFEKRESDRRFRECTERELHELRSQVRRLKDLVRVISAEMDKPKGTVKGFYVSPEQGVINCSTEEVLNDED